MFICAFFAVGCSGGGGGDSFVASPGGGVPAGGGAATGTGSVTFNFVRAQSPIVVPTSTVQLRFEFFTGLQGTGTILKRELRNYADTVTIENVPNTVRSTVVTAITADGFPIAEFTANVTVQTNGNVTVNATDGTLTPVTAVGIISSPQSIALGNSDSFPLNIQVEFSNGDIVPVDLSSGVVTFASSEPSVATVENGSIIAGLDGTTFITATLNAPGFAAIVLQIPVGVGDGVQPPPTVDSIEIITPAATSITLPRGTMQNVVVRANFSNGNQENITLAQGLTLTSNDQTVPQKITVQGQNVIVANDASVGLTARITANYLGREDFFDVQVTAAEPVSISVTPSTVSLPYGGFTSTLVVERTNTDGTVNMVSYLDPDLDFSPNSFTRFTLDESTGVITTNSTAAVPAAGQQTVTVSLAGVPSVDVIVEVGALTVSGLAITPNPLTGADALVPGEQVFFNVVATLSDNSTVNVSNLPGLELSTDQPDNVTVGLNDASVTASSPTPSGDPAEVIFTLLAAGTGGADFVSNPVLVEVLAEVINLAAGIRYDFAGNDIANFPTGGGGLNAVNLPRGYVGVIEVFATFNSGVERRLRPGEYEILLGPEGQFPGGEGIKLWQTDDDTPAAPDGDFYAPPDVDPQFTMGDDGGPPFEDLYFELRDVVAASEAMDPTGSSVSGPLFSGDQGVALTRRTFRAVVADWRRNAFAGGAGGGGASIAVDNRDFPGGTRRVIVRLSDFVLPDDTTPVDEQFEFTVTIVDPPGAEITSAGFVGANSADGRTPIQTVREFEVRASFDAVTLDSTNTPDGIDLGTRGPTVSQITNFKLAEANINLISNVGGAATFARSSPTDLGFVGLFSETSSVQNNIINVRAIPVGGDNVRPVLADDMGTPADFADDSYLYVNNVFGTYSGGTFEFNEFPNSGRDTDPTDGESDPGDAAIRVFEELDDSPVQFLSPILFSVDPPTVNATTPAQLEVGASQRFRTVVQWVSGGPYIDVSQDYPPVMFADTTNPAASARLADPAIDTGSALGNIIVTALTSMGDPVDDTDLDTQTGDTLLSSEIGAGSYAPTQALIVALDAAGFPIPAVGQFGLPGSAMNANDLRGNNSNASAVSAIQVVDPAP